MRLINHQNTESWYGNTKNNDTDMKKQAEKMETWGSKDKAIFNLNFLAPLTLVSHEIYSI